MKYLSSKKKSTNAIIYLQNIPIKVLCHQNISLQKSQCGNLPFIKKHHSTEACLYFDGFDTERTCEVDVSLKLKCGVINLLIKLHRQY